MIYVGRISEIINQDKSLKLSITDKIKESVINEYFGVLKGEPKRKQSDIAKDYDISEGRVSQIINDFRDMVYLLYCQ